MDGDNIRHGLNNNLGFSAEDRQENIRRIGEVAKLFADMGVITLVSFISPYRADRDSVRARMDRPTDFVEVFMKIPIEVCEERDPKGLYKAARAGKIKVRARPPREPPPTPARRPVVALAATGRLESAQPAHPPPITEPLTHAHTHVLQNFTGIDDPYEEPLNAEIVVTAKAEGAAELEKPEMMAKQILDHLASKGYLQA